VSAGNFCLVEQLSDQWTKQTFRFNIYEKALFIVYNIANSKLFQATMQVDKESVVFNFEITISRET
jgi:hypothetical protein